MKKITYRIADTKRGNPEVTGYRFDHGGHVFGIRGVKGHWRVDHVKSGRALTVFGGATRKGAAQNIVDRLPDYADQMNHIAATLPTLNEV